MEIPEVVRRLEQHVEKLEARIEHLEKTLCEVLGSESSSQGTKSRRTLRCQRLLIEDADGKTRAELSCTNTSSQLLLFDPNSIGPAVSLHTGLDISSVDLYSHEGHTITSLRSTPEGTYLELKTHDGGLRARLMALESGGGLSLLGETGGARVTAGVANDHGQLALSLSGGDTGVALGTTEDGGHIIVCDEEGHVNLSLP